MAVFIIVETGFKVGLAMPSERQWITLMQTHIESLPSLSLTSACCCGRETSMENNYHAINHQIYLSTIINLKVVYSIVCIYSILSTFFFNVFHYIF